jgi:tetratricopeptide (TPR) repeat protein
MPAPIRRVDELGFPIPPKFEDFQTGDSELRPPRRPILRLLGRWRWLILLLVPAILFGPQAVNFVRGIVANIQLERAEQDLDHGDFRRALFHVSRAIAWEPDGTRRAHALALRAEVNEKLNHLEESLRDCNEGIDAIKQLNQQVGTSLDLAMLYRCRAWVQHRRGHDRQALDDCKTAIDDFPGPHNSRLIFAGAGLLNLKAYICALSGLEVEDGMKAINEALGKLGDRDPAMLDTRACLEYRQGKLEAAMSDMELAIQMAGSDRHKNDFAWDARPVFVPQATFEIDDESYAVMLYHRGEIHRKLASQANDAVEAESHSKEADADIARAKKLGFDSKQDEALEPAPRG